MIHFYGEIGTATPAEIVRQYEDTIARCAAGEDLPNKLRELWGKANPY